VQVGDIVRLKPEVRHRRLCLRTALVVRRFNAILFYVLWHHTGATEKINGEYFEVVSASRP
jgi:hypothetical protein